jgi:cell division protein FtsN
MTVERFGSKTDVVVKLVLVFFVCLLSFSIGTFVGKKFSDNQHKMAQFEPSNSERDVASVHPDGHEGKPQDALTDDEVAKLAEEFVAEEKTGEASHESKPSVDTNSHDSHGTTAAQNEHAEKVAVAAAETNHAAPVAAPEHHEATPVTKPAAHAEPAHKKDTAPSHENPTTTEHSTEKPMKAAVKVAHGEAPVAEKVVGTTAPARIPSSLPKELANSAIGKFTVQVASYPTEEDAKKMATELKNQGFSAFFVSAKIKDRAKNLEKTWYRVSVGLFTTQKEAEAYKADLLARSKVTSAYVQKISE